MQQAQAYYLTLTGGAVHGSRWDRELVVNCAGLSVLTERFVTHLQAGREDYYVQYLVSGRMDIWVEGVRATMHPGQAIVYYPRTEYHYATHGADVVGYYWIHFTGSEAKTLLESCNISNRNVVDVGVLASVVAAFDQLFSACIRRDDGVVLFTSAKLVDILLEIGRKAPVQSADVAPRDSRVQRALSYIHRHYSSELSVGQLARVEHLSVSRFRSVFKEQTGLSPLSYIIVLRMNRAAHLLAQTDLRVSEVAHAVGYRDPLYFSRLFRKHTGRAPLHYRPSAASLAEPSYPMEEDHEEDYHPARFV